MFIFPKLRDKKQQHIGTETQVLGWNGPLLKYTQNYWGLWKDALLIIFNVSSKNWIVFTAIVLKIHNTA